MKSNAAVWLFLVGLGVLSVTDHHLAVIIGTVLLGVLLAILIAVVAVLAGICRTHRRPLQSRLDRIRLHRLGQALDADPDITRLLDDLRDTP